MIPACAKRRVDPHVPAKSKKTAYRKPRTPDKEGVFINVSRSIRRRQPSRPLDETGNLNYRKTSCGQ
jgi:hypothetical protein